MLHLERSAVRLQHAAARVEIARPRRLIVCAGHFGILDVDRQTIVAARPELRVTRHVAAADGAWCRARMGLSNVARTFLQLPAVDVDQGQTLGSA